MHRPVDTINSYYAATRANLSLAPRPARRRHSEMLELPDFEIDCGDLAVEAALAFDVTREDADPETGHLTETWTVTGEIIAVKVSGLTIRRNLADPYNCDLLNFISEDTPAALDMLRGKEQHLIEQVQSEYETGDRVFGGTLAAE